MTIHFDHGTTYEQILWAIQTGFTSLMFDGSMLPFDENIAQTRRASDAAHAVGLSVEGELGTIGKTDGEAEDGAATIVYTDPDDAVHFVEQTQVDSLAVAIGTCHGIYPSWMKPELKLDLLKDIKSRINAPLVLHGGSGNPDSEIAESVVLGINKINISSDIKVAYHDKMREVLTRHRTSRTELDPAAVIAAMQETAAFRRSTCSRRRARPCTIDRPPVCDRHVADRHGPRRRSRAGRLSGLRDCLGHGPSYNAWPTSTPSRRTRSTDTSTCRTNVTSCSPCSASCATVYGGERFVATPEVVEAFAAHFPRRITLGGTSLRAAVAMSQHGLPTRSTWSASTTMSDGSCHQVAVTSAARPMTQPTHT